LTQIVDKDLRQVFTTGELYMRKVIKVANQKARAANRVARAASQLVRAKGKAGKGKGKSKK